MLGSIASAPAVVLAADPPPTQAQTQTQNLCQGAKVGCKDNVKADGSIDGDAYKNGLTGKTGAITNTLLILAGAIAVIVIIVGGIRYILSQGNAQSVTAAKDTILYAVIGLVVVVLAYAIVNFVTGNL